MKRTIPPLRLFQVLTSYVHNEKDTFLVGSLNIFAVHTLYHCTPDQARWEFIH